MAIYNGTNDNDTLTGTEANDVFNPLLGQDIVDGEGGINQLNVNYLSAVGSAANNVIVSDGEGGFYGTFSSDLAESIVSSVYFSDIEKIVATLSAGNDYMSIEASSLDIAGRTLSINGGAGFDLLEVGFSVLSGTSFIVAANGAITSNRGTYSNFEQFYLNLGGGTNTVTTQGGNDSIFAANGGTNTISTGAGNDAIYSYGGVDQINGGADADTWNGDFSASATNLTFTFDGATGAGTLSNGTTLAGIETGNLTTGSGDDSFTIVNNPNFTVTGGAGRDTLNRSDAGLTGIYNYSQFSSDGLGGFTGNVGNGSFYSIENINVTLSDDDNNVVVYADPLASGATLNLSGGLGFDTLQAVFTNLADTTFTVAANGAITSNRGTYSNFEQFYLNLGGGTNTVTTQGGNDSIFAANGGTNTISTGAGADTVYGGLGNETVNGGSETDYFYTLGYRDDFTIVQDGAGGYIVTDINLADGDQGTDRLVNVEYISFGIQLVELPAYGGGLTLTGTSGNDTLTGGLLDDTISGLGGADQLQGLDGNDLLNGGTGNDTIDGGTGTDTATYADATAAVRVNLSLTAAQNTGAAGGTDRLVSIENLIGSAFNDTLTGNSGDNVIDGLGGNNTLVGGAGNDTLSSGAGTDRLDGGLGVDTMTGGAGNDTYTVDNTLDVVTELVGGGSDAVNASATFTLSANVERLTLTGAMNIDGIGNELDNTLTGNSGDNVIDGLGGNNTLVGGAGNDTLIGGVGTDRLDGGLGVDTMTGGAGNDTYTVDNTLDVVTELVGGGTDAVSASVTFTLSANVERLTLTGAMNIDGTGNELDNTLTGNTSNNTISGLAGKDVLSGGLGDDLLIGGLGADTLTGGAGADRFRFDVLETTVNKDTVKDFVRGTDVIELSRSAFSALAGYGAGALNASELALGTNATLPGQHLVYNAATGALFYDNDGSGAQAQVQIAVFSTKPLLDAGDFALI